VTSITTNLTARTETTQDYHGNTWVSQLNSLGQITSLSDPDSGMETREYNSAGELTATVNALSERTELTYDLLGRLLTKTTRAGTGGAETTTFTYDQPRSGYFNKGFQTTMTDVAGTLKSDFDALGRPARTERTIDSVPYTATTSYNTAGLPSSTTYPDSQTISWTYDAVGNLQTETGTITASTYDAAGRVLSRWFTNGAISTQSYSPSRGWIENIQTVKGTTTHQNLTYQYYPDGMIQSVTSAKSMESWSYAYDDLNRLLAATNVDTPSLSQSFTYNEIGNITYNSQIGTYTYPASGNPRPHAVSTAGARTYSYNAAGQMTSRNGTVIQWNGDGKPSSIGNVGFVYDGVGTRLKKLSGGQTTKYVGGDYEIAPNGTVTKYLVGGKQVGTSFFVHHRDHLGSIQAVTDNLGAEVRRQKHKPFGDQHYASGSHLESKGWIGEREEETELVYLNARFYDPDLARFVSPDPIALPGQLLNRYTYSRNNPVNFADPSGLYSICGNSFCEGGGGGGGGTQIFFFDFSNCSGMALARGDCDPGLQPYASDVHGHDPTVDAMLAEEEARHDEMVNDSIEAARRRATASPIGERNLHSQGTGAAGTVTDVDAALKLLHAAMSNLAPEEAQILTNALGALSEYGVSILFVPGLISNGTTHTHGYYSLFGTGIITITLAPAQSLEDLARTLAHEGMHILNVNAYYAVYRGGGNPVGTAVDLFTIDDQFQAYMVGDLVNKALSRPTFGNYSQIIDHILNTDGLDKLMERMSGTPIPGSPGSP
jgi:RHS repeat-associated protein